MTLRPQRLWFIRLKNGLQALLVMTGLALVLSVPGYLLAGTGRVINSRFRATANTPPTWKSWSATTAVGWGRCLADSRRPTSAFAGYSTSVSNHVKTVSAHSSGNPISTVHCLPSVPVQKVGTTGCFADVERGIHPTARTQCARPDSFAW